MAETILITGAAGFIGSHLSEYWLQKRPQDRCLGLDILNYAGNLKNLRAAESNPRFTFIRADINDAAFISTVLEKYQVTGVIHLAAQTHVDRSITDPDIFTVTNTLGTAKLLAACRHYLNSSAAGRFKFIQVSTDEVFGSIKAPGRFNDDSPYHPNSPYAASKAGADHLVWAYWHTYQFPALITYASNNFGSRQYPEKLIPLVINRARTEDTIPVFGNGEQSRDWLYVQDHVRALMSLYEHGKPGNRYTVSAGNDYTNNTLITKITAIMARELKVSTDSLRHLVTFTADRPGHDCRYALSAAKIRTELNWHPLYDFDTALTATVKWYLQHPDWYGHE